MARPSCGTLRVRFVVLPLRGVERRAREPRVCDSGPLYSDPYYSFGLVVQGPHQYAEVHRGRDIVSCDSTPCSMKYFDAHTHVNFVAYSEDRDATIRRAAEADVVMNVVGTQKDTSADALALAEQHDNV